MKRAILNISAMPKDPIEQIVWLDTVQAQVDRELDALYRDAYFWARTQGRFATALQIGKASRKRALAWTRAANEARGRQCRWGDGY